MSIGRGSRRGARVSRLALLLSCAHAGLAGAQTLPSPWLTRDIGGPALVGSATYSLGVFDIDAAGIDIKGTSDQFHFVYQRISGDVDVVARVDSVTLVDPRSRAGIMIRSALTAGAAHGSVLLSAAKGVTFQCRTASGGISTLTSGPTSAPPRWLRLVRSGTTLTAYSSLTGATWTAIGSDTIALGASAYVGLAATSRDSTTRTTALVSQVALKTTALPWPLQNQDIGSPAVAGSASYSNGTFTVKGAGKDIWDVADQFHYVYQPITGDVDVSVRVASIDAVDAWSKAGVMIRESLNAGSRYAMALASVSKGYAFRRRLVANDYSGHTSGGSGTTPGWVRLVRTGTRFEAFRSADGRTWTSIGSDQIAMADAVYVGIAVNSHDATAATTAMLDDFTATPLSTGNQPPVVSLTSPATASTFIEPATISLAASASDPDGTVTLVDFYQGSTLIGSDTSPPYSVLWPFVRAGTYSLTAVAYDDVGASAISAAVPITVSTDTSTAPTAVVFQASPDDATLVVSYRLDIFASGTNPSKAPPVASSDLGHPTPASDGGITVDRATFFGALAPGTYQATVSAIGSSGSSRSAAVTFTR